MSAILLFAMRTLDIPLRTHTAPSGIVSFELAANYAASQQILDSWSTEAKINALKTIIQSYFALQSFWHGLSF
jgi:hypothetical protein